MSIHSEFMAEIDKIQKQYDADCQKISDDFQANCKAMSARLDDEIERIEGENEEIRGKLARIS